MYSTCSHLCLIYTFVFRSYYSQGVEISFLLFGTWGSFTTPGLWREVGSRVFKIMLKRENSWESENFGGFQVLFTNLNNCWRASFMAPCRGGSRGRVQGVRTPPPWYDLRFSNTTGILQKTKKTMWFIGVEVEQETSAPPPKKNPGSAPAVQYSCSENTLT